MRLFTSRIFPILILGLVLSGCSLGRGGSDTLEEEPKPKEISQENLPFVKLLPRSDRHRVDLGIYGIKAPRIDYQILYTVLIKGNSVERGAGGRDIKLNGKDELIRVGDSAIVFGSESSGRFKYDDGVENGSIEITYRDEKGKSTGRTQADWHLEDAKEVTKFTSPDGKLVFTPSAKAKGVILILNTLSTPIPISGTIIAGPYGIYASEASKTPGTLSIMLSQASPGKLMFFDESAKKWREIPAIVSGKTLSSSISSPGLFVVVTQ